MRDALAAQCAARLVDGQAVLDEHVHVRARTRMFPNGAVLDLGALRHAAHAFDALRSIANKGERLVPQTLFGQVVTRIVNVELTGKLAQGARLLTHAGSAFVTVALHERLQILATCCNHARRGRVDNHALAHFRVARRNELAVALHQANTARCDIVETLHPAERGDVNTSFTASAENGHTLVYLHFLAVDNQVYHVSSPLPVSAPMPNTSQRKQRPHS